ncbi:hypothetical protein SEA_PIPER2020_82 [Mycobacterium phage Piper2020]|nr:hypothetical protein SEA_PIPER2020_82 [Mycobacterium phage Piper2020]
MSDAQKIMSAVQRRHRRILNLETGRSHCQGARRGECDFLDGSLDDFEAHVAAEIDKALGTLRRVERWVPVEVSGHRWAPRDEASAQAALALHGERGPMHDPDCDSPLIRIDHESSWVSNWMKVQPHA